MGSSFPADRFDNVPSDIERVGAHRAPARRGRGWIAFAWAAVATVALVAGGIFALSVATDRLNLTEVFSNPTQEATKNTPTTTTAVPTTAAPTISPDILVNVLNGTKTPGLAGDGVDKLTAAGWPAQNLSAQNASEQNIEKTVVYYENESQEGAARGVLDALGVGTIEKSDKFSIDLGEGQEPIEQITVVLGADYVPPAEG